jgi:hypothetical protein
VRIFAQKKSRRYSFTKAKKNPPVIMSVVGSIIELSRKETPMINFDNVINEDAIAKLTDEQAEALLAILEKAGY